MHLRIESAKFFKYLENSVAGQSEHKQISYAIRLADRLQGNPELLQKCLDIIYEQMTDQLGPLVKQIIIERTKHENVWSSIHLMKDIGKYVDISLQELVGGRKTLNAVMKKQFPGEDIELKLESWRELVRKQLKASKTSIKLGSSEQ